MSNNELDEIVDEFIVESYENLDHIDQALVQLEQKSDPDTLAGIFRSIHTIKGTSGFLGFSTLESITHVGENLLSKLRDGNLAMSTEIANALLAMVDAVRAILTSVESTGLEPSSDYADLVAELGRLDRGEPASAAAPTPTPVAAEEIVVEDETVEDDAPIAEDEVADDEVDEAPTVEVDESPSATVRPIASGSGRRKKAAAKKTAMKKAPAKKTVAKKDPEPIGEKLIKGGRINEEQLSDALDAQAQGDPRHVGELLVERQAIQPKDVVDALVAQNDERHLATESIRVDVRLLDDLMNYVGELVLARNQILQFTDTNDDPAFLATTQRLNLITSELQEGVMKTRMQPIENVWNKFPRVVRDLTVSFGKKARLEMEGKSTELDKTLLEAIKDPLTHLVRNAVDHGLETAEARVAAGKPAEGVVKMRARHEGGLVVVEISDDGAGIDPAKIRRKAVEKGLLSSEEAAARNDRDIVNLIFQPGFSTATSVTNISGRGVGMDVVRTNIESIGGSVDVSSVPGSGTTFTVKIPLTLAIIPALIVTCADERYAIPQVSLLELVRVETAAIEQIRGQKFYRLRGKLIPLIYLDQMFGHDKERNDAAPTNIVVLQADERIFGLVVDEINDTNEIVVKPLGRFLQNVGAYAGATIMGDGRVALILDVLGLAGQSGLSRDLSELERELNATETTAASTGTKVHKRLLVVRIGERRFALSLDTVARLEEFRADAIETANHRPAVQYGTEIMPLVSLADELGVAGDHRSEVLSAIVFSENDHNVGLVIDEIVDIVEEDLELDEADASRGVLGSFVIEGRVTDLVDIRAVLQSALPHVFRKVVAA